MWKLKTISIFTIILGLISLGWIVYDYLALTDIAYNTGDVFKRRMISYGVIPILLFHFSFFATMYFQFDFLKHQKFIIKEHRQLKSELETQKAQQGTNEKELTKTGETKKGAEINRGAEINKEKEIKIADRNKPGI